MIPWHRQPQLPKASLMSQHHEQRRRQAIDHYLAEDKVEDICRHLACCEKLALQVAKALRCTQCRLGSGTTQKTQKPPDANPGTRRTGRRVPAPDIAPQRHRWWRRRYHTDAYPARYRASALPTHHVPYSTPPSQGGEITWVKRIQFSIPCSDGLSHIAKVVNA